MQKGSKSSEKTEKSPMNDAYALYHLMLKLYNASRDTENAHLERLPSHIYARWAEVLNLMPCQLFFF